MDIKDLLSNTVGKIIVEREIARENKNYILADFIRSKLDTLGIEIKDTRDGSDWDFKRR